MIYFFILRCYLLNSVHITFNIEFWILMSVITTIIRIGLKEIYYSYDVHITDNTIKTLILKNNKNQLRQPIIKLHILSKHIRLLK